MNSESVSFLDVLKAARVISAFIKPTPLYVYPALNEVLGAQVFVKHENYQPVGVFKIRGAINLVSQLAPEERARGVITASTGNHGLSIAYASRLFGVRASIVVPEKANPVKVEAIRSMGAEIIVGGRDFDDCRLFCKQQAEKTGARRVSTGDEPLLIAGVGTCTLEILEEAPEVEMIFVAVGSGTAAAGACLTARSLNPAVRVIATQSSSAPAAYLTWKHREPTTAPIQTIAEGLATGSPFLLPQEILWKHLDDFILVEDQNLLRCVRMYLEIAKTLVEPAGAASLAAAIEKKKEIAGRTIAVVISGGNISPQQLGGVL